jgi:hypothetical protein
MASKLQGFDGEENEKLSRRKSIPKAACLLISGGIRVYKL